MCYWKEIASGRLYSRVMGTTYWHTSIHENTLLSNIYFCVVNFSQPRAFCVFFLPVILYKVS